MVGEGEKVIEQSQTAGTSMLTGERVILVTNGTLTMPDITGWSRLDVMKLSELTGIDLDVQGNGYVTKQSVAPGEKLSKQTKLTVELK